MRTAILIRTGSFSTQSLGSPRGSPVSPDSGAGISFLRRSRSTSLTARSSLHLDAIPASPTPRSDAELVESSWASRTGSIWSPPARVAEEELDYSGGDQNHRRMGEYYEEMLRSDPGNALLLRNYGRFLHEVEGDAEKAEECYGRAILASPGDGEVLSLYGKLVWETHGDGERAAGYFRRAVEAAPDDSCVLASYASFLWDAREEEDGRVASSSPLVEAL